MIVCLYCLFLLVMIIYFGLAIVDKGLIMLAREAKR